MAGSEIEAYGFVPDDFRAGITLAMRMASPNQTADKATFRWDKARTFEPQDPQGEPYHWSEVPTTDLTHPDVVIDEVAVEYVGTADAEGTSVGVFLPRRAIVTILDTQRALIEGANWVLLHQVPWGITEETVQGLGAVDVYTLTLER